MRKLLASATLPHDSRYKFHNRHMRQHSPRIAPTTSHARWPSSTDYAHTTLSSLLVSLRSARKTHGILYRAAISIARCALRHCHWPTLPKLLRCYRMRRTVPVDHTRMQQARPSKNVPNQGLRRIRGSPSGVEASSLHARRSTARPPAGCRGSSTRQHWPCLRWTAALRAGP